MGLEWCCLAAVPLLLFWLEFLPGCLQMSTGAFFWIKNTVLKIPTYTWRMSKPSWVLSTWKHILRNSSLESKLRSQASLSSPSYDFPVKTPCFTDPLEWLELPGGFVLSAQKNIAESWAHAGLGLPNLCYPLKSPRLVGSVAAQMVRSRQMFRKLYWQNQIREESELSSSQDSS